MNERDIERILSKDYSAGTDQFRDALLKRCLDVLESDSEFRVISDSELDLVAAAGAPNYEKPEDLLL